MDNTETNKGTFETTVTFKMILVYIRAWLTNRTVIHKVTNVTVTPKE